MMDFSPLARIVIRYIVGLIIGMDSAAMLSGDPDVVTVVALGIGAGVEIAYTVAKRKGWAT